MLAIVAPGQGAQTPGFLTPWVQNPTFRERLLWLSAVAGIDLVHYGTEADADTIRDTAVAQPLLTAAALLSGRALLDGADADVLCGHSVGELPALALAGVLPDDDVIRLAAVRGCAMAAAATSTRTGMAAVLGGAAEDVTATAAALGLTVATARTLELGAPLRPALLLFAATWLFTQLLAHAGLPLLRLSWPEDGGELGRAGLGLSAAAPVALLAVLGIAWAVEPPTVHLAAGVHQGPLAAGKGGEHKPGQVLPRHRPGRPDPHPQPGKGFGPQGGYDGFHPVVPAGAPPRAHPQGAQRQVDVVVNDQEGFRA